VEIGLDGIAITDHNSVKGCLKAKPLARELGIELIPGYELKTKEGDILIFGTTEVLKPLQPAEESVELARDLGAVLVAAHPFDPFRKGIGELINGLNLHGVEVANSHCVNNRRAKYIAIRNGLAQVGGSDAHISREIGNAYTLCDEDPLTAIKTGRCTARGGLKIRSLPIAMTYGVLTIPGRLRERVKRWKLRRLRRTR
jgi:predicted metal-dependent phosphoesterase TrpH